MQYKGFTYKFLGDGKWSLQYPSGYTGSIKAENEEKVKEMIDHIIANFKDPKVS
jgi:hypothetical protein